MGQCMTQDALRNVDPASVDWRPRSIVLHHHLQNSHHKLKAEEIAQIDSRVPDFFDLTQGQREAIKSHPIVFPEAKPGYEYIRLECTNNKDRYKYYGQHLHKLPDGHGYLQLLGSGALWVCSFDRGEVIHPVHVYLANGDYFVGETSEFEPFTGKLYYSDGGVFEGPLVNGKPQGDGIYTFRSLSEFMGPFVDGKPNGIGVRTHKDGTRFIGQFGESNLPTPFLNEKKTLPMMSRHMVKNQHQVDIEENIQKSLHFSTT